MTETPHGSGMGVAVDLLLVEAIVRGLAALHEDARAVDELVQRGDTLRNNTASEWQRGLRQALGEALDPHSQEFVVVRNTYPVVPGGVARLPWVSVTRDGSGENAAEQWIGDVIDEFDDLVGPNGERVATTVVGGGRTSSIQVAVWSPSAELSSLLVGAIEWALQNQKARLMDLGVHELSWSDGGAQSELDPRVTYTPILAVSLSWTRQQTFRRKVPNRATLTCRSTA